MLISESNGRYLPGPEWHIVRVVCQFVSVAGTQRCWSTQRCCLGGALSLCRSVSYDLSFVLRLPFVLPSWCRVWFVCLFVCVISYVYKNKNKKTREIRKYLAQQPLTSYMQQPCLFAWSTSLPAPSRDVSPWYSHSRDHRNNATWVSKRTPQSKNMSQKPHSLYNKQQIILGTVPHL